jgi:hypothetical protein
MSAKLSQELAHLLPDLDPQDFRDLLNELHQAMCPSWSIDELLVHPSDALVYCGVVRRRLDCHIMPEDLILRTLINTRKHG